ncbi:hypothetical protein IB642_05980 [Allofrancisella guangzhouensis]|uniref:Immunity protein 40 domain-containing protein n=1 Tax=Allofrancisella guangzhouensis TaxID=594679 RepID=A0A0A8E2S3_9GAMM|nr:Imm40 family immunity protein [Allofrancisella guangzhouensis]AJC48495.1 hypothetical protein SD28_01920 [Allofrancisella guangzhouensis]MBK2028031.1 hypothetical protein [Allofrancisella guangzhouensis]MBK2044568.1 hypothetical protein [Allofrancisella guangzhouensis]MBK2046537.1 hypothetical protein [Allofrancisella guangzhouensis]
MLDDCSMNQIKEMFAKGVQLENIGINEKAFSKESSLIILDLLNKFMIPILGGDVYIRDESCDVIIPTYDSWYYERAEGESCNSYIKKSVEKAKEYIVNYPKQNVLFTLVFDRKYLEL